MKIKATVCQAMAACSNGGAPPPAHIGAVRGLCAGKQQCEVKPLASQFGVRRGIEIGYGHNIDR